MIRHATDNDITRLKKLWHTNFHDSQDYINFVYSRITTPADTLVYEVDGKIVSMLTIIPVNFAYYGLAVKTMYVYGAATSKKYEGRGYMSGLLKFAEDYARDFGFQMSVLVPGNRFLFKFYKARGYNADFNCRVLKIKPGMISQSIVSDVDYTDNTITPGQLFEIRREALSRIPNIEWNVRQLNFVFEDLRLYKESIAYYNGRYGESYAVYSKKGSGIFIKECLGTANDASLALIKDIILKNSPKEVSVVLPVGCKLFEFEGERMQYGMAKRLDSRGPISDMDPYMNLMLD